MKRILVVVGMLVVISRVEAQHVGIGTDDPQSNLHVIGDIRSDSLHLRIDSANEASLFVETGVTIVEQTAITGYTNATNGWQSFMATKDGNALRISLYFYLTSEVTQVRLYEGEVISDSTQLISMNISLSGSGWQSFPPFDVPVDSGSLYTVWMDNINGIAVSVNNPYPNGRYLALDHVDITFRIFISDAVPVIAGGNGAGILALRNAGSSVDVNGTICSKTLYTEASIGIGTSVTDYPLTIRRKDVNNTRMMAFTDFYNNSIWKWDMPSTNLRLGSASVPSVLTLDQNGNVGIGTSGPTRLLDVQASGTNSIVAQFASAGGWSEILIHNQTQQLKVGVNESGGYLKTHSGHDLRLQTGGSDRIFIDHETGNVGIGTTNPGCRLYVRNVSTTTPSLAIFEGSGTTDRNVRVGNADKNISFGVDPNTGYVGSFTATDFTLRTGGINRVFIRHSNGFVGINTTSPEEALHVNGDIQVTGQIVNDPVAVPELLNGWVNYGDGFEAAGYYKDKEGVVHLQGLVKNGTDAQIMTLPPDYRPASIHLFTVISGSGFARIDVRSDGTVILSGSYNSGYVSLSGITFRV